ncbi:unnamed protein product [Pylaiella littoralis]
MLSLSVLLLCAVYCQAQFRGHQRCGAMQTLGIWERGARKCCCLIICGLFCLRGAAGFRPALGRATTTATWRPTAACNLKAALDPDGASEDVGDSAGDQDGSNLMSELMGEVNQRESLLRREGVRLLKRPSALLPPHTSLEHVLTSLQNPDFPTEGGGWHKAFLFSALDHEVSRGPVDFRRDWTDEDDVQPRFLDKDSFAAVMGQSLPFLAGMASFTMAGEPVFSDDDHRVTFPIRVVADETKSFVNWAEMDFRLGRVRDGSHKDCWLVERAIIKDSGHDMK